MPHSLTNLLSIRLLHERNHRPSFASCLDVYVLTRSVHRSSLNFLLSAPLCLLSRALLLPPDSQVFICISSAPPYAPLAFYLNTFTIPALSPLISSLLFTFSRILAFLSNSTKPSVVGSIIRNTVTESWW